MRLIVEFTTSEFRQNVSAAYNAAQTKGSVVIKHRDRPDMILITQSELDRRIEEAKEKTA